jgi:hypothetical protein
LSQDYEHTIRFVYAQLKALSENMRDVAWDDDAENYNSLVEQLVSVGFRAEQFKLDASRDTFEFRGHRRLKGGVLARQVAALLTFFELVHTNKTVVVSLPKVDQ